MGVVSLAVFGSVAGDESTPQSDIDLLVEFSRDVGLFHLFEIQHRLEEIIGVPKVDLIQKGRALNAEEIDFIVALILEGEDKAQRKICVSIKIFISLA